MRSQLIKRYFLTGLLIWVPLVITGWVLSFIVSTLDQSLRLLPQAVHPQTLFGFPIPGAGSVLTLAMILLTGLLATNFIGQKLVVWWEMLLARIPFVNSVYHSVKQVSDTLFFVQWQCVPQGLARPVSARRLLDDCLPYR